MRKILLIIFIYSYCFIAFGDAPQNLDMRNLSWNGIDVVWVKDERFPLYNMTIYFADGSGGDGEFKGATDAALSLLDAGTRRYNRKRISDILEYYGTTLNTQTNHEFSTINISGLIEHATPSLKMICHLLNDASYPKTELLNYKKRGVDSLESLVNSPGALADRIFREISLEGSDFSYPVSGKIKDIKKLTSKNLKAQKEHLINSVKKRIYIVGPSDVLNLKEIITNDCRFDSRADFIRKFSQVTNTKNSNASMTLVTVPKADQAQIRVGRILAGQELQDMAMLEMISGILGGGFTSVLMNEVRVKRGLTYGIDAFAARQRDYGRAVITTFTKNESVEELLDVVFGVIANISKGDISSTTVDNAKGLIIGSYPFKFENQAAFLSQVLYMDHIGENVDVLYSMPDKISSLSKTMIYKGIDQVFSKDANHVVVLGDKKLEKALKGKFKIKSYLDFL